jgi:hypothetical protein
MTKSQQPLSQQATLLDGEKPTWSEAWRRECEARDWIRRYKMQVKQMGKKGADQWWIKMKRQIGEARGQKALDQLVADMNGQKDAKGKN